MPIPTPPSTLTTQSLSQPHPFSSLAGPSWLLLTLTRSHHYSLAVPSQPRHISLATWLFPGWVWEPGHYGSSIIPMVLWLPIRRWVRACHWSAFPRRSSTISIVWVSCSWTQWIICCWLVQWLYVLFILQVGGVYEEHFISTYSGDNGHITFELGNIMLKYKISNFL